MKQVLIFVFLFLFKFGFSPEVFLPINNPGNRSVEEIQLTEIGRFGVWRKDRPKVPGHFHTGIDIMRPSNNYQNEPVFPIAPGIVISKRDDGPYAQIIIEHQLDEMRFWTVYEHIAGILVSVEDTVFPGTPIARFMNRNELNNYGWQFDHFHFEVLKIKPISLNPTHNTPERYYNSYSLSCYTINELNKYFYDPIEFFNLMRG